MGGSESSVAIEVLGRDDPDRAAALRLAMRVGPMSAAQIGVAVEHLAAAAEMQGLNMDLVLGARISGRLVGGCVAVASPGRTALTMLGPSEEGVLSREVGISLLRALQQEAWARDLGLLQSLLPRRSSSIAGMYRDSGFRYLTELVYQERAASHPKPAWRGPTNFAHLSYCDELKECFIKALDESYEFSLDCPGLKGIRDTREVLRGHLHTGISDPEHLWFLGMRGDRKVGVLLLSGVMNRPSLELVYMGVSFRARGQGVGNALLSLAVDVGRNRGAQSVTLAVDGTNVYACRLYERWGFVEVARRRAWICVRPG